MVVKFHFTCNLMAEETNAEIAKTFQEPLYNILRKSHPFDSYKSAVCGCTNMYIQSELATVKRFKSSRFERFTVANLPLRPMTP